MCQNSDPKSALLLLLSALSPQHAPGIDFLSVIEKCESIKTAIKQIQDAEILSSNYEQHIRFNFIHAQMNFIIAQCLKASSKIAENKCSSISAEALAFVGWDALQVYFKEILPEEDSVNEA